jgi:hypothetical protein
VVGSSIGRDTTTAWTYTRRRWWGRGCGATCAPSSS